MVAPHARERATARRNTPARRRAGIGFAAAASAPSSIEALQYNRALGCLIAAGEDPVLRIFDLQDSTQNWACCAGHGGGGATVVLASDESGCVLATGDSEGFVMVWDVRRDAARLGGEHLVPVARWPAADGARITGLQIANDNGAMDSFVVTAAVDGTVRLWTLCGQPIGFFGQGATWNLAGPGPWMSAPTRFVDAAYAEGLVLSRRERLAAFHTTEAAAARRESASSRAGSVSHRRGSTMSTQGIVSDVAESDGLQVTVPSAPGARVSMVDERGA